MSAAAVNGVIGGMAVAIAGALSPLARRLGAAVASCGLSVAAGYVVIIAGLDRLPHSGLLVALLTGAVIPVAAFVVVQGRGTGPDPATPATLPERSALSLVALALGAVLVFALNLPFSRAQAAPPRADPQWAVRLNLPQPRCAADLSRRDLVPGDRSAQLPRIRPGRPGRHRRPVRGHRFLAGHERPRP